MSNKNVTFEQLKKLAQRTKIEVDSLKAGIENVKISEYSLAKQETADTGYSATYQITKDGDAVGEKIQIPDTFTKDEINGKLSSVYKPGGSSSFNALPPLDLEHVGYVFNVTDEFTTTNNFLEGEGKTYRSGTNVVIVWVPEQIRKNDNGTLMDCEGNYILVNESENYYLAVDGEGNYIAADFDGNIRYDRRGQVISIESSLVTEDMIQSAVEPEHYAYDVLAGFVDLSDFQQKEEGKGLSTNDYTNEDKDKLANIEIASDYEVDDMLTEIFGEIEKIDDDE